MFRLPLILLHDASARKVPSSVLWAGFYCLSGDSITP